MCTLSCPFSMCTFSYPRSPLRLTVSLEGEGEEREEGRVGGGGRR